MNSCDAKDIPTFVQVTILLMLPGTFDDKDYLLQSVLRNLAVLSMKAIYHLLFLLPYSQNSSKASKKNNGVCSSFSGTMSYPHL